MKRAKKSPKRRIITRRAAMVLLGLLIVLLAGVMWAFFTASRQDFGVLANDKPCPSLAAGDIGSATGSYVVRCTVEPARYIIVDKHSEIIGIVSNTRKNVPPIVKLNTMSGPTLPYSGDISRQYSRLLKRVDFSKPGIVYRHSGNFFTRLFSGRDSH